MCRAEERHKGVHREEERRKEVRRAEERRKVVPEEGRALAARSVEEDNKERRAGADSRAGAGSRAAAVSRERRNRRRTGNRPDRYSRGYRCYLESFGRRQGKWPIALRKTHCPGSFESGSPSRRRFSARLHHWRPRWTGQLEIVARGHRAHRVVFASVVKLSFSAHAGLGGTQLKPSINGTGWVPRRTSPRLRGTCIRIPEPVASLACEYSIPSYRTAAGPSLLSHRRLPRGGTGPVLPERRCTSATSNPAFAVRAVYGSAVPVVRHCNDSGLGK